MFPLRKIDRLSLNQAFKLYISRIVKWSVLSLCVKTLIETLCFLYHSIYKSKPNFQPRIQYKNNVILLEMVHRSFFAEFFKPNIKFMGLIK